MSGININLICITVCTFFTVGSLFLCDPQCNYSEFNDIIKNHKNYIIIIPMNRNNKKIVHYVRVAHSVIIKFCLHLLRVILRRLQVIIQ